ncbi:hypothetical protein JCM8097_004667 [Rhodosporidiobolus ruineniae]
MPTILPSELILAVLTQLDPADSSTVPTLLAASLASTSLNALARSNTLWRPIVDLKYHQHRPPSASVIAQAQLAQADDDDGASSYRYFRLRALKDRRSQALSREIHRPLGRLPLVTELRQLGSDVLEHGLVPTTEENDPEAWLSSRYWTTELRKTLLRDEAVDVWTGIATRDEAGEEAEDDFERGLNAFGAFRGLDPMRLPAQRYDMVNHPRLLESTANPLYDGTARLEWLSGEVVDYMASIKLNGATEGFHDLDNNVVELSWARAELAAGANPGSSIPSRGPGTLPMTLVAIFCSLIRRLPVAQQLKIRAYPVGFPGTLLAGLKYEGSDEMLYVNVFSAGKIMRADRMKEMLRAMNTPALPEFFQPASARSMCIRVARNILTSIRQGEHANGIPLSHDEATSSLYSIAHAFFLLTERSTNFDNTEQVEAYADWLVSLCQAEYPHDVAFIEQRVAPTFSEETDKRRQVLELCQAIREEDQTPKEKKWVNGEIRWRIGMPFRHRLFGYKAVIRGWDYKCEASEQWIRQMQVDRLPRGRDQPFYHVLVSDGSSRYVAAENITGPLTSTDDDEEHPAGGARTVLDDFLNEPELGKFFRKRERQEDGAWVFVPSEELEAEYPDS